MGVALRGNLKDFGIGEVFQLIGQQRKTGILEVEGVHVPIHVSFDEGSVVCALTAGPHEDAALADMLVRVGLLTPDLLVELERLREARGESFRRLLIHRADLSAQQIEEIEDLVTRETIFGLLLLGKGSFHFHTRAVSHQRPANKLLPAEQILMDGLRMVDEWRTLDEAVRRDDTVFQRVGGFEVHREFVGDVGDVELARAERLYFMVDGRLTTRRVIDLSRLGTFEGARLLSGLKASGVISALDAAALARTRRRRALDLAPGQTRAAALAVMPFVLLALVALATREATPPPEPTGLVAAAADPVRVVRAAAETRRLRNLVEAYYFATGAWPEDLRELVQRGWIDASALASPLGAPYYYERRPIGTVLLAPEL